MLVEPSEGNTPGTLQPESVSTKRRRIAMLARSNRFDRAAQRVREAAVRGSVPERICQVKNRMREIRTSGSVRGEGGNPLAYSTSPSGGSVKAEGLGDGPAHGKFAIAKLRGLRLTLPPRHALRLVFALRGLGIWLVMPPPIRYNQWWTYPSRAFPDVRGPVLEEGMAWQGSFGTHTPLRAARWGSACPSLDRPAPPTKGGDAPPSRVEPSIG
jgi:hypothetical protein